MDFAPCIPVLEAIRAGHIKETPTGAPIQSSALQLQLDTAELLAAAKKRRKEADLTQSAKAKRAKKIEKSHGYFEKLEARDKDAKANRKPGPPWKKRERARKKGPGPNATEPPASWMRQRFI
jgi:hypothetical protein